MDTDQKNFQNILPVPGNQLLKFFSQNSLLTQKMRLEIIYRGREGRKTINWVPLDSMNRSTFLRPRNFET